MNNIYFEKKTYAKWLKYWRVSAILCCFFLLLFPSTGNTQTWQRKIPALREIWKTFQTPDGGFVVMGRIGEDNIWEGGGNDNIALAKLDIDGNLLWLQEYDFQDQDIGYDMIQTSDGGFLIAGHTNSFFDFSSNILLLKTDANGNKLWHTSYGNNTSERPTGLIETADGGYAFTGCYDCFNTWQTLLCKVDVNGNLLFHKNFPGPAEGRELIETPQGFVIVGWKDEMLGDSTDINIIKTYPDGNLEWEQTLNNPYYDIAQSIQATSDTTFVLVGGIDLEGNNTGNVALFKMHINGQMIWENTYSGDYGDYAESLIIDEEDNIIIGGNSWNNLGQNGDFMVIKTDSEGQEIWTRYFGDELTQIARDITLTQDGGYAICGVTKLLNPADQYIFYGDAFLVALDKEGNAPESYIDGFIYHDLDENCGFNNNETPLKSWYVRASNGTNVFYGVSDETGHYNIDLDSGNYVVELMLNNGYWLPCNDTYNINLNNTNDSLSLDFPLRTLVECSYLEVDISVPFLIPCQNQNYTIEYCNHGPTEATEAWVEVVFDPDFTIVSTELPFSVIGQDTLAFELGDIPVGQCESFEIGVKLDCNVLEGATHCMSAHIYPDSICLPVHPAWDGSSITVEGECINNTISYRISNVGEEGMSASQDFIVIEDHIIYRVDSFLLGAGEEVIIPKNGNGKFSRIEVEQSPFHPGMNFPNASVEACGDSDNPSLGYLTQYPQNDGDSFVSIDCQINMTPQSTITKHAQPVGFTPEHLIQQGQEIEYHVYFENNVTDSVFRVVVRDTLSPFLDWATVQPGASSHPYTFDITSNGIITFTFDDILLLYNSTNTDQSSGYIKFKVQQLPGLLPGTVIWNTAHGYFNYDMAPFQSNEIFHTINMPYRLGHTTETICQGECFLDSCYNEVTVTMLLDTIPFGDHDSITFYMLEVLPTFVSSDTVYLHSWEDFQGEAITNDTVIQVTYTAINGCDSIVDHNIFVILLLESFVDTSICVGECFLDSCYTSPTTSMFSDTILVEQYDSIIFYTLEVLPTFASSDTVYLHSWEDFQGEEIANDTVIQINYMTFSGCDSILDYNIFVIPLLESFVDTSICVGECFLDSCYTSPTTIMFSDTILLEQYDSITFYTLEVLPTFAFSDTLVLHSWENFQGQKIPNDIVVQVNYTATNGCDSIVDHNIFVIPLVEYFVDTSACAGSEINGIICFRDTTFIDTILSQNYNTIPIQTADSIRYTHVNIHPNKFTTVDTMLSIVTPICGAYYTTDTSVVCSLFTINNCDSIVTYNIQITTGTAYVPPLTQLIIFPNPTMTNFTLSYQLNQEQRLHIELFDGLGRKHSTIMEQDDCVPGSYTYQIAGARLTPGIYYLLIHTNGKTITRRIVKVRD